ncbi:ROK family transcriptional regulator [Spiractinospora alimapuensis]|uniref:ROK family transcriptional regulator n=1 Tax=Spiractinospora alimapuensis TaxID=2820884 RepID=UPI001F466EDF|nr:ROK family transcriptional regulator [Spiractinospora alimapuensis]QVQ52448.1 ROK family transcriptional regulator [Spiractinospora alimapuensis]
MKQSGLGGGPQTLRLMNCAAVLRAIRGQGSARARELMRATGLSRPTVTAAVDQLIEDGWVEEAQTADHDLPRMGRPARVLRFRANARYVVGVDVGPNRVQCSAADLNGRIVAETRLTVSDQSDPEALLELVTTGIRDVMARVPIPEGRLAALGVGTPGVVDARRGLVVRAPSLPGWDGLDLGERLGRHVDCHVHVENDVNLAVMAEQWSGVGSAADSLVLVQWGARVGGAVLVHGRLHQGAHGAAGEIGFVELAEEPAAATPDGLGPLESRVGTSWILRRARDLSSGGYADVGEVLHAAGTGDATALRAVDEACAHLARGLAPFLAAVDPEIVVLGGGITRAGDVVLDSVSRHLARRTLVAPILRLSTLADDAVTLGALRLALADAERRLLDTYAPSYSTTAAEEIARGTLP